MLSILFYGRWWIYIINNEVSMGLKNEVNSENAALEFLLLLSGNEKNHILLIADK